MGVLITSRQCCLPSPLDHEDQGGTGPLGLWAGSVPERSLRLLLSDPFLYPLLVEGPEELGDSVGLPRSFMVLHASSDFYFGTHKGQSQSLPAGMARCIPAAAGFPSLLGPTNREA